jgi:hypothetical protein
MARKPLGWAYRDPRRSLNFLDSCAFDPKYSPEHEASENIRRLRNEGKVVLHLAHSNQKEIEHPNTPAEVKKEATEFIYSRETSLIQQELERKAAIHRILTGNGNPKKYEADATHVFEAGKYGGYFVTTDERILGKKAEIERVCGALIVKPTEWLLIFETTACA